MANPLRAALVLQYLTIGMLLLVPWALTAATLAELAVVPVVATAQASPAQITLTWTLDSNTTSGYVVRRKLPGAFSWTTLASLAAGTTSYIDGTVTVGIEYEYQIEHSTSCYGYIASGINLPVVDARGAVIVLVDAGQATALASELTRLEGDLRGDGWLVLRHDIPSTHTPPQVKALISADHSAYPGQVKSVVIIGHVAVPYAGNIVPDGHTPDHQGAWPADTYYADLSGTWTDTSVNTVGASRSENHNIPGDGKFDQSTIPAASTQPILAVGRVDLWGFASHTATTETNLLRQYLDRDHAWRTGQITVQRKALVDDGFTASSEAFAQNGWRLTSLVGAGNVLAADWFTILPSQSYLWAYGCGGGSYTSASGVGSTANFFGSGSSNAVFTMLFGSYHGDWDVANSFLRAPLAGNGLGLTCSWAGRPNVYHHRMGMGATIGEAMAFGTGSAFYTPANYGARFVHQALMGDPTLRLHPMLMPSSLAAAPSGSTVTLTWSASADAGLGYHIYRSSGSAVPTRLTTTPSASLTYSDTGVAVGTYTYFVRAVRLEATPSGSYINTSIGAAISATVGTSNIAPTVAAGLDQSIALPSGVSLDATVTDDGLPSGTLTHAWSTVSGPGTVTFANAALVDTTATFSAAGVYVLRLTASDGALSANDTVQVTVTPTGVNSAPSVSAGPDQTILLPAGMTLDGTVLDDGLPSGTLTHAWSTVSGPGTVTVANAALVDTTATFSVVGVYVLRLSASDGALSANDTVQVTVGVASTTNAADSSSCGAGSLFGLILLCLPLTLRRRR